MFFCQTFCSKNFSTAPLTLGFSQLISVGQKSSVTNSGVKRVIFEIFTFYFAQRYSTVAIIFLCSQILGEEIKEKVMSVGVGLGYTRVVLWDCI